MRFSEHGSSFLEELYKSSCSLINAVMKYLNFRSSGLKLDSVTCEFTKKRFKEFQPNVDPNFAEQCRTVTYSLTGITSTYRR